MSDFHLVDPQGWEYDLQSIYSAYIGYFQLHCIPWHDRTWSQFFETFEQFLAFSWPVITVTDARTGRAHIVTRMSSIAAFLKMIKSRFGELLPQVDNMLLVTPLETSHRHLRHVDDWSTYKKLHSALPAVALAALKARVRFGDPNAIRHLWSTQDKTFLALDIECLEKNDRTCVEWGYAAIRSTHLVAAGAWPPVPDANYRKGHYIISEYADMINKPSSWKYAFGESQMIPKAKMPRIIQSVISSLASPESETVANNVVLVGHGVQVLMQRLDEMKIKLPPNMVVLDVAYLERALFATGERGPMVDRKTGQARQPGSLFTLGGLLRSYGIEPPCMLHHAGNDAFMTLLLFQRMMETGGAGVPGAVGMGGVTMAMGGSMGLGMGFGIMGMGMGMGMGNGNGNGVGKGQGASDGQGHVKRATIVAARFFRPFGGHVHSPSLSHRDGAKTKSSGSTIPRNGPVRVDEMGMMNTNTSRNVNSTGKKMNGNVKRASMLSALRSPLIDPTSISPSTDKHPHKKEQSRESTNGSGSGRGIGIGMGWLAQSKIVPGQRRHSTIEKRQ